MESSDDDNYDENDDTKDLPIQLSHVGVVDVNSNTPLEEKRTNAIKSMRPKPTIVSHGEDPINTYNNPEYWVNSSPWLFPYGSGGAEMSDRPNKSLSLRHWVRHLLNLEDPRFRQDRSFMYVAYNILQVRDRTSKSKVLVKRMFGNGRDLTEINSYTSSDFDLALEALNNKDMSYLKDKRYTKILKLIEKLRLVGSKTKGSIYERGACRSEILGFVVARGLPQLFVTINPSAEINPITSFWCSQGKDKFNLDTLLKEDGKYAEFPNYFTRSTQACNDPLHAAQFFHVFIKSFLESFLGYEVQITESDTEPTGELYNRTIFTGKSTRGLTGFYGTVEAQGRGSLHLHLLVWLNGIPSPSDLITKINEALNRAKDASSTSPTSDSSSSSSSSSTSSSVSSTCSSSESSSLMSSSSTPSTTSNLSTSTSSTNESDILKDLNISTFLDSIISQQPPLISDDLIEKATQKPKNWMSLQPNYYKTGPDEYVSENDRELDLYRLTKQCLTHKCESSVIQRRRRPSRPASPNRATAPGAGTPET